MEVYVLDSLFRTINVVDDFESFIWAERMRRIGDVELDIASTTGTRSLFIPGARLAIRESKRVMTIETTEDSTDNEGKRILKVKGRSLEAVFEKRLAMAALTDLTTNPKWELTGLPKAVAEQLFHDICVSGILNTGDIITGVIEGSIFPADTIDEPSDEIIYSIDPKTLYEAMTALCDAFAMGFRLVRDPNTSQLYFDVYMGSDRTTAQTSLAAVVFSPDLDNLVDSRRLSSMANYANVAYVVSPVGHEVVYPLDVDSSIAGFDRRVLFVKADDITDPVPADASAKMIQFGMEALAQNRQFVVLDGELGVGSSYIYGTHYNLADLVELRDDDGGTTIMQVSEQTFASDAQGNRSYPTLEIQSFVTPGSWRDLPPDFEWRDFTTEHWSDL